MGALAVQSRLQEVWLTIEAVCKKIGRDPRSVRLVAVSKHQPVDAIQAALDCGQIDFGENYAQELRDKAEEMAKESQVRWHFLGPLQRNKVRFVVGTASLIQSVDRFSLLQTIADHVQKKNLSTQNCLIEVNLGAEAQKPGCLEKELPDMIDGFLALAGKVRCLGLMCIPPINSDPEQSRPYFRKLKELLQELRQKMKPSPFVELKELSMGMSHDFPIAIEEGATIIRVGTAIFGPRPKVFSS